MCFLIQITTGKAANAVQGLKHINSIISTLVPSETVRRVLRKNLFKAVTKKKKALAQYKILKDKIDICSEVQEVYCEGLEESYLIR